MSRGKLHGKVAIVTGSTRGIGYEIAKRFAVEGANVMICSRKQEHVDEVVENLRSKKLKVSGVVCDVGNKEHRTNLLQQTLQKYGQLDCLVVSAGVNPYVGPFLQTPERKWDHIFDINVKCAFLLARDAMPHLRKTQGSILYNSSVAGKFPLPDIGAYSLSKRALDALIQTLAIVCGEDKVRVNGISPGTIDTQFAHVLTTGKYADLRRKLGSSLQRFGKPEECAGAAVFLCSDDASYITGEIIPICGGETNGRRIGLLGAKPSSKL